MQRCVHDGQVGCHSLMGSRHIEINGLSKARSSRQAHGLSAFNLLCPNSDNHRRLLAESGTEVSTRCKAISETVDLLLRSCTGICGTPPQLSDSTSHTHRSSLDMERHSTNTSLSNSSYEPHARCRCWLNILNSAPQLRSLVTRCCAWSQGSAGRLCWMPECKSGLRYK